MSAIASLTLAIGADQSVRVNPFNFSIVIAHGNTSKYQIIPKANMKPLVVDHHIFWIMIVLFNQHLFHIADHLAPSSFIGVPQHHPQCCDGGWAHFDFLGFNLRAVIYLLCQGFCWACCFTMWATFRMNTFCPRRCVHVHKAWKLGCRQPTLFKISRKVLPVGSLLRSLADGAACFVFVIRLGGFAAWSLRIFLFKIYAGARIFAQ